MYFERWYYVYIMSNRSKTLYIGITGKFTLRVFQHKTGVFKGFTSSSSARRMRSRQSIGNTTGRHGGFHASQGASSREVRTAAKPKATLPARIKSSSQTKRARSRQTCFFIVVILSGARTKASA